MSDAVTKKDLDELALQIVRLLEPRFKVIEGQLEQTATRDELNRLTNTIDAFLKRLEDNGQENAARDAQLARLERWIETIAQKTGIKLEY